MWKEIGNACMWKHLVGPSARVMSEDEGAMEAILTFLPGTKVGYVVMETPRRRSGDDNPPEDKVR